MPNVWIVTYKDKPAKLEKLLNLNDAGTNWYPTADRNSTLAANTKKDLIELYLSYFGFHGLRDQLG